MPDEQLCSTPGVNLSPNVTEALTSKILLRPEQGAQLIDISRTRMFELIAKGEIESVKIGRCRRIPRAALDEYVDRLRAQTQQQATPAA